MTTAQANKGSVPRLSASVARALVRERGAFGALDEVARRIEAAREAGRLFDVAGLARVAKAIASGGVV